MANASSVTSPRLRGEVGSPRRCEASSGAIRVRGTLRESESAERAPHPNPLPAKSGAREQVDFPRLPVGIWIHEAAPAAAVERGPLALRLRQAIGYRVDHGGLMGHAPTAAFHLAILSARARRFHAALPSADPDRP